MWRFIGLAEIQEDLSISLSATLAQANARCASWGHSVRTHLIEPIAASLNWTFAWAQPMFRFKMFPRQVFWSVSAAFDMIWTALA
jgi:hypothetical protein